MNDGPEWFARKRYGYGAGLPISWQGWALTIGYVLLMIVIAIALNRRPLLLIAADIPPTVAFITICARTTKGGWRWRWGGKE